MQATQRSTHLSLVLRLLPQLWVYGQDPEQGQQPFWTTAIVLCHHSAAQEPREGMERASFWRCARLLICISDADAAPQCSQLALRSLDAPAHWAIMTAAARRLVTTSAASNASVARVPAVPQSRRAPIRRTSCKPGRPKGPPTQTGRLPFSSTLSARRPAFQQGSTSARASSLLLFLRNVRRPCCQRLSDAAHTTTTRGATVLSWLVLSSLVG